MGIETQKSSVVLFGGELQIGKEKYCKECEKIFECMHGDRSVRGGGFFGRLRKARRTVCGGIVADFVSAEQSLGGVHRRGYAAHHLL